MAPEHPSMWILIGSTDKAILQVAEQVYCGEWTLASSVLSCWQQDDCMRELQQELNRHMSRAGLQGAPGLAEPSRSRSHSCGCSTWQAHSPSEEPWGREVAKWPREVSPTGQSGSQRWCSQLRTRADGTKVPHQNAKGNPSHPPLVPKDQVLQVSDSVSIWNI